MKNHGAKLLRMTLLLLAALTLLACKKDEEVAATPSPTVQAQTESFQQSLEGIWSTEENQGDDAETLYAIEWLPDLGLCVVRDGAWLDGKVEDVDLDNLTLALHLASQTGPSETVTLRKVPEKDAVGPFTLRVTFTTLPLKQWTVRFALDTQVKRHFDLAGVRAPVQTYQVLPMPAPAGPPAPAEPTL